METKDILKYAEKAGASDQQMLDLARSIAKSNFGDMNELLTEIDGNLPQQLEELREVKDATTPPPAQAPEPAPEPVAALTPRQELDARWDQLDEEKRQRNFVEGGGILDETERQAAAAAASAEY